MTAEKKSTAELIVDLLEARHYHISCAESCTGGLLTAGLVDVPNASRVLEASVITYSNSAKVRYAGVPEYLLEQYGAVSEPVAVAMARGVALANQAEVGVGISGIAGPSGGTPEKPVGTVCFGFFICGYEHSFTQYWPGVERNQVRQASVDFALKKLIQLLDGHQ